MDKVKLTNDFLFTLTRNYSEVKLMRNNNITDRMLNDKKHLSLKGFQVLLANIRFTLFGKLPRHFGKPRYNDRDSQYGKGSRYN